jgi:enoyl-CoA hydratase/carnithine racemase
MVQVYEQRAPLSLKLVKRAVRRGMEWILDRRSISRRRSCRLIYGTQDKQEGISAFLEKRTANSRAAERHR